MLYSRDVGESLVVPGGAKVIDAHKKYVMPGNL
jgi:imidazolonepropionase-like amidohydrolase